MHKRVVIICDGQFPKTEYPRYLIQTADFIICCDGSLKKFIRNSVSIFGEERLPDLVIGDMDTLPASWQKKYADIIVPEGGYNRVALEMLNERIHALPVEVRKHFVDVMFNMLESTGVKTLSELNAKSLKSLITMIKTFNDLDKKEKELMLALTAELLNFGMASPKYFEESIE